MDEQQVLEKLFGDPVRVPAQENLVRDGDRPTSSTLLVDGFAGRYKYVKDGSRQITALHGPGDFVDLHSFLLKKMDHGVVALTACLVMRAPHSGLQRISETHPHLFRVLSLLTLIDGAIHREWLVAMGRRSAVAHAAHLLCEVYSQLRAAGLSVVDGFPFPITQADLGDMLGLSAVHTNRVLQELRAQDLIEWVGQRVRIIDWPGLVALAEYDDAYLHLHKEPR